jgi:hypothetical protein
MEVGKKKGHTSILIELEHGFKCLKLPFARFPQLKMLPFPKAWKLHQ